MPPQHPRPLPVVHKQAPTRRLRPGDLICPDCGEGNPDTRRFCSRCGASLTEAEVVRRKWWQRLIPRRGPRVRKAGVRPARRKVRVSLPGRVLGFAFSSLRRIVAAGLLIVGILYGIVPTIRTDLNERVGSVKRTIQSWVSPSFHQVHATSVRATAQVRGHAGSAAVDGFTNTYWAAPITREPVLILSFQHPVDLARAIIHSGDSDNFEAMHRPQRLHLVFNTGQSADLNLNDTPEQQKLDIAHGKNVTRAEIHIVSVFRSISGNDVALSELELFRKD